MQEKKDGSIGKQNGLQVQQNEQERPGKTAYQRVLLFDGVCNLCNGAVQFVIRHDRYGRIHFAPLDWEGLRVWLETQGIDPSFLSHGVPTSVVFVEEGRVHEKSDAVLRITRYLRGAWPLLTLLRVVPIPIRDFFYDKVARNRYRWFGRRDECLVPTVEIRSRFINWQ